MASSTPGEISEILANAKKAIEERKAQLGLVTVNTIAEDKKNAIMALKARIAATAASAEVQNILASKQPAGNIALTVQEQLAQRLKNQQERERSLNLIIDAEGRTIDRRTGEVVQIQSRMPTLKANIKAQKRDYKSGTASIMPGSSDRESSGFASVLNETSGTASIFDKSDHPQSSFLEPAVDSSVSESFFDNRLKIKPAVRNKRKLLFNEKGKYEEIANKLRTKSKLSLLQQEIASISKKTGISSESRLALIQPKKALNINIPNIEWWDYAVLSEVNYDCLKKLSEDDLKEKLKISSLIEHPVQMKPPSHTEKKIIPAVMLTAKERKKMRRQNRAEAMKEQQEKIRLGLMPPPEPKVKISNLMRVLGTEAVQDPTKVEEYVRNQMAKRQKMHEEQNEARKLTDAERAAKKKRKIMENTSTGVNVSVYRVKDLSDPAVKFKVEANCNQLHMTGIVLLCKNLNVVVVEGGPKQQKKFKRLMLNRIKWSEIVSKKHVEETETNSSGVKEKNQCALVWEGQIKSRSFGTIIFKMCPTTTFARDYFKKYNCEHYWDIAQTDVILQMADS